MQIEHHKWFSQHLNRDMELKVYGHYGQPVLVLPCSQGNFYDYENFGMINAISHHIDAGKVKIYTIDSIDHESWYNHSILSGDRSARQEDYNKYVYHEVIPFVRQNCMDDSIRVITNGASMGAYHAVNLFLRYPDVFCGTIALSGLYRLNHAEFQINDGDMPFVYFNSPISYLPGMNDDWYLNWYQQSFSRIYVGQGAFEEAAVDDTRQLQHLFHEKGIPANFDYWGHDVNHDWPWWFKMMDHALAGM